MNSSTLGLQVALSRLGYRPGPLDGQWGPRTAAALDAWRRRGGGTLAPPEALPLGPLGSEVAALTGEAGAVVATATRRAAGLSLAALRQIAQKHTAIDGSALLASLCTTLALAGAHTPGRAAHLLAQLAHESDLFRALTEYASGAAYEGRSDLGNTEPGDGRRYRGRGWIQLTGRANYRRANQFLAASGWGEEDLVGDPVRAAHPEVAAKTAAWYWLERGINALADADNIEGVTRAINGGLTGLDSRRSTLARARAVVGA